MAKISRALLKGIVKECLVEILSEGISADSGSLALTEYKEHKSKKTAKLRMRQEEARLTEHREKFETRVTDTVSNVTDDPIMREILADTAKTTLQEQMSNEGPGGNHENNMQGLSDPSSSAAGINLDSIFGSPDHKWKDIAFPESKS
jgi:hypothetical protein